jgi:hypothetical protein
MGFRKAASAKIGGKFLVYGDTGTGKSEFSLTFPKVASIDSETGIAHYEGKNIEIGGKKYNNLVMVDNTSDLDELESDLDEFLAGTYDDSVSTLSIDSETKFYNTMQVGATEVEERRARKNGGDVDDSVVSSRQWGRIKIINMKMQQAKIDLSAKGVHIVSIAQATDLRDKKDSTKIVGDKPDMHKSVPFDYDTVLRFFTKKNKDGEMEFFAEVIKDRTCVTKVGDIIPNCTFDVWKDYYDKMSKLSVNKTSYSKDLKSSTESMVDKADKVDELVVEWKDIMKSLKNKGDVENLSKINTKLKELKIDVKNINLSDIKDITELVDYSKSLLSE